MDVGRPEVLDSLLRDAMITRVQMSSTASATRPPVPTWLSRRPDPPPLPPPPCDEGASSCQFPELMTCLALSARSAFSVPVIGTAALPLLLLLSGRHLRARMG